MANIKNTGNPFEKGNKHNLDQIKKSAKLYKRIGPEYYLYADKYTAKKEKVKVLKRWRKTTIKDDHGPKIFDFIEKFIDFALVPDNTVEYSRNIGGCYNIYEPIIHIPLKGVFPTTEKFLEHIFGDYLILGLDYLTILFTKPGEKLPAICLVSKEQKTGKSTFLFWLSKIFGDNAVILGNEDFGSNFNSVWADKLLIGIDESFIEKRIIKEKVKRLVTDHSILTEQKGVDKVRRDFIGKFILLSNNETNFIRMDKEDNRFFVLKVPTVTEEDPLLLDKLKDEIPAFLHFLRNRKIDHPKKSRLWFLPKDYETEAQKEVVKDSVSLAEKYIVEYLADLADNIIASDNSIELDHIKITPRRIADYIIKDVKNISSLHMRISDVLKNWGLEPNPKSERYSFPIFEYTSIQGRPERIVNFNSETGRFYKVPFDLINSKRI